jgi:hypothetical protein
VAVFAPQEERPINYNVKVLVCNKPTPLQLNVKGEGYALSPSLVLELPDDGALELSATGSNTLDFGQVRVEAMCVRPGCTAAGAGAGESQQQSARHTLILRALPVRPPPPPPHTQKTRW